MIHSSHIFILIISHVLTVNTISERLILALFRGYSCVKILLGKGTALCKNICSKWFINSKIGPNISSFNESMPFTMWSRCFFSSSFPASSICVSPWLALTSKMHQRGLHPTSKRWPQKGLNIFSILCMALFIYYRNTPEPGLKKTRDVKESQVTLAIS